MIFHFITENPWLHNQEVDVTFKTAIQSEFMKGKLIREGRSIVLYLLKICRVLLPDNSVSYMMKLPEYVSAVERLVFE